MNWLTKNQQRSGYCDFQTDGPRGDTTGLEYERSRKAELVGIKDELMKKAVGLGHDMKPWSNINTAYCRMCSRRLELPAVGNAPCKQHSASEVLAGPCDHRGVPSSRELAWSEMNATLWS